MMCFIFIRRGEMPPPRNTSTGQVLESMVLPALDRGGYSFEKQKNIGPRLGRGRHVVDLYAEDEKKNKYLISMKWQQVSGTAEQKVPYEVMCLADANKEGEYKGVYLVLGGEGWSLKDFYISEEFKTYLTYGEKVEILTLEAFVALANQGKL